MERQQNLFGSMKNAVMYFVLLQWPPPLLAAAQPGRGSVEKGLFIVELKTYFETYCIFSGWNVFD